MSSKAVAIVAILALLVVPAGASATSKESATQASMEQAAAQAGYIVVYRSSGISATGDLETQLLEGAYGFKARFRYRHALKGFAARLSDWQVEILREDPRVAGVSADRRLRALTSVPITTGDTAPPGVVRIGAATATTAHPVSSANIAVIDSGIDLGHPDLAAVNGEDCIDGGAAQDDNGHGTHVAGIIAAKNDGAGIVGVAPGTKLYAVKALDSTGEGYESEIICGVDWVTANAAALNIKVANMSVGGLGSYGGCYSEPLHLAICNSTATGVTFTVAAGNSGWDFGAYPPDVPASYPEVLTVTAMSDSDGQPASGGGSPSCDPHESDDRYASFSNYAGASADAAHTIAAPGVCILSTWLDGGYDTISGTSMAAPHVAGTIALCIGEEGGHRPCAGLTPAQIIQKVRSDAASNATQDNGFTGDPNRPVGAHFGYLASAIRSTAPAPAPAPSATPAPTPTSASNPAAEPAAGRPTSCFSHRHVRKHRHVRIHPHRSGRRHRHVRVHRHVRRHLHCG